MSVFAQMERLRTPAAIAAKLRSTGGVTNTSTINRWIVHGVRGPNGDRVKLRAVRVGDRWFVDPDDFDAFVAALNPVNEGPPAAATIRSPGRRNRDSTRASAELATRHGVVAR